MNKTVSHKKKLVRADMAVLDVVSRYRRTEYVFKKYDQKAGECICCQALFDPLKDLAQKYGLNLANLLAALNAAAGITKK